MTSAAVSDVNTQFAAEKAGQVEMARQAVESSRLAQADYDSGKTQAALDADLAARVADGKIRMIGEDRYRVLVGWDANEVFAVKRARRPQEIPLILPLSGLDLDETGRAQLYTAVPTWHSLEGIGLIPGGTTDISTVLKRGGIDFLVMQEPVTGAVCGEVPGQFINYRSDTKAPLGVVGKIYTPAHPRQQLSFLQDIAEAYDVPFESAGPLNGGKQVFVSMKIPQDIVIDAGGLNESVQLFLVAFNSNDGEGKLRCVATPWRPICGNTNRFALRDAVTSWGTRHTLNWQNRAEEARHQLGMVLNYSAAYAAEETQLAQSAITLGEVEQLLGSLFESKEDPTLRERNAHERRLDAVFERFALESGRVGRTAYAAENAITGYLDNDKGRNAGEHINMAAARATANLLGTDDKVKNQAHKLLLLQRA